MGFFSRKTSKQTSRVKKLLKLALERIATARRPRLARKSISRGDVSQFLALGHLDRALHRAEKVIEEDNMLQAFDIIELYCKRLIEHAAQLDKPQWCGDLLPELPLARTILADKFGKDLAVAAKEGTGIIDPMLVWKLCGSNILVDFSKLQKEVEHDGNCNGSNCQDHQKKM